MMLNIMVYDLIKVLAVYIDRQDQWGLEAKVSSNIRGKVKRASYSYSITVLRGWCISFSPRKLQWTTYYQEHDRDGVPGSFPDKAHLNIQ